MKPTMLSVDNLHSYRMLNYQHVQITLLIKAIMSVLGPAILTDGFRGFL
jgi:hypothetical protein